MKINTSLLTKFLAKNKTVVILTAIVLMGFFLRAYHFRDWLYFYPDQARDVMIAQDVASGRQAWPLLGPIAASTPFKVGPVYYYFQIISAKIFGAKPETVAYPDLFFGTAAIVLLFFFLKKYFSENLSLLLTGLFSISFYAIRYSRFAWNTNPIPFFCLLFLLALYEFLLAEKNTKWAWVILLGVGMGVGMQLHTVLLVMMPIVFASVAIFMLHKNFKEKKLWLKLLVVLVISIFLNGPEIYSETQTNFANSKYFMSALVDRSPDQSSGFVENFGLDIICHTQANVLFLSSLDNNDTCDSYTNFKFFSKTDPIQYSLYLLYMCFGFILLLAGPWLMLKNFQAEKDVKKKKFLGLTLFWSSLTFIIILPIVAHNGQVRYLLPVIFAPFIFLGLVLQQASRKLTNGRWIITGVVLILIAMNFITIFSQAQAYEAKSRSNSLYVVLGEIEAMRDWMIKNSDGKNDIYLLGGQKYLQNFAKPFSYVLGEKGVDIFRASKNPDQIPEGQQIFYIGQNDLASKGEVLADRKVIDYQIFGNIGIYKLQN